LTGAKQTTPLIIDEVQKLPELLDEVQWLIVNRGLRFILCGSSVRKLKRGGGNLLGGRAVRLELHPLTWREINRFSLARALNHGLLPRHYEVKSSTNPTTDHLKGLRAFKEEFRARRHIVVSQVDRARRTEDGIDILPWQEFLTQLWDGAVLPRVS